MINNLKIRPAKSSDSVRVQELRKEGWQDNYVNEETGVTLDVLINELAVLPPSEGDIKHYKGMLGNPSNLNLVAEADGKVIGTVVYDTLEDGTGDIGVFVDRSARGHGVGSALLNKLVTMSKNDLQVIIFAKNRSRGLYKKFGFKEIGPEEKHYFRENVYLPIQTLVRRHH